MKHDQQKQDASNADELDKQMEAELASLVPKDDNFDDFDDDTKINLDDLIPPQGDLDTLNSPVPKTPTTATPTPVPAPGPVSATKPAVPSEPLAKASGFKFTPVSFAAAGPTTNADTTAVTPAAVTPAAVAATSPKSTTAVSPASSVASSSIDTVKAVNLLEESQRKLERARRFGLPVTEDVRKLQRAAKFGVAEEKPAVVAKAQNDLPATAAVSPAPVATRNGSAASVRESKPAIDPEVMKRRQERFGIVTGKNKLSNSTATTVTVTTTPTKVLDPVEEEKKRKRMERFGLVPGNTPEKVRVMVLEDFVELMMATYPFVPSNLCRAKMEVRRRKRKRDIGIFDSEKHEIGLALDN
ncbi:hypothetical protein BC936DRAFT_147598 [Jimgerdemannia flammicorona]|uniref:THO1-MOS11 C-terminal domain-containing protein n=1 Tax=Jimgerdemannia flammicorona TaxID=994334 RepID=A0A433D4Z9_9FUNG|nr:hypothetical protein BC936DRAFT_147598 [Jimgerdemannia flammicorona]